MDDADIALLRRYRQQGDESAFAELVTRHGGWISAAARRRLGDDHLADDATQSVFLVLADKAEQLIASRRDALSPWLFHVMHFTCARLRRTQIRQAELQRHVARSAAASHMSSELLQLMEDSIAQLATGEREMVIRRFYLRQSFDEIGAAANISPEAARKRITRALAAVRTRMLRDGIDAIPDVLLADLNVRAETLRASRFHSIAKRKVAMNEQQPPTGGYNLVSIEFLVSDVEQNLEFFEKLGFPRRWLDKPDPTGRLPRASLTAGAMGKIWIRRAPDGSTIHPSPSINPFFWVDGGPDGLVAHRARIAAQGVSVTPIIDEHALPIYSVTTPDGYSICFFTQYV